MVKDTAINLCYHVVVKHTLLYTTYENLPLRKKIRCFRNISVLQSQILALVRTQASTYAEVIMQS